MDGEDSLLQSAFKRAKTLTNNIFVISEKSHAHHILDQLPQLKKDALIVEPARRGTANCLLAGLRAVRARFGDDEPIGFVTADHLIRDVAGFTHSFKMGAEATKKQGRVCLVGVEPTYPSTGFGYIEKGKLLDEKTMAYEVVRFREKPPLEVAQDYVQKGNYLWNCSYFIGSVKNFEATIKQFSPKLYADYQKLLSAKKDDDFNKVYLSLTTDTIDYALNDHVSNYLVVPASFDWVDVGSYQEMYDVSTRKNEQGNVLEGKNVVPIDVQNSLIHNQGSKPLAVIGLDNVIVINTPHGVLVTRKDQSQKVKEVVQQLEQKN